MASGVSLGRLPAAAGRASSSVSSDFSHAACVAGVAGVAGGGYVTGEAGVLAHGDLGSPGAPRGSVACVPGGYGQALPASVTIVWGDGTVTTVHPPAAS
jgi:hypothetical protein